MEEEKKNALMILLNTLGLELDLDNQTYNGIYIINKFQEKVGYYLYFNNGFYAFTDKGLLKGTIEGSSVNYKVDSLNIRFNLKDIIGNMNFTIDKDVEEVAYETCLQKDNNDKQYIMGFKNCFYKKLYPMEMNQGNSFNLREIEDNKITTTLFLDPLGYMDLNHLIDYKSKKRNIGLTTYKYPNNKIYFDMGNVKFSHVIDDDLVKLEVNSLPKLFQDINEDINIAFKEFDEEWCQRLIYIFMKGYNKEELNLLFKDNWQEMTFQNGAENIDDIYFHNKKRGLGQE